MRLLNVETLRLTSFPDASLAPPYAILSHRWEEDEVLFEDLRDDPLEDLVASLQTRLELLEHKQGSDKPRQAIVQPPLEHETSIPTVAAHETGEISESNSVWTAFKDLSFESRTKGTPNETLTDDISSHRNDGHESELSVDIQFQLNGARADYEDLFPRFKNAVPEESFEAPFKAKQKRGFGKLSGCVKQARHFGFHWVWIDNCCIDKTSSSELSESINSMFNWYRDAKLCIAYISDVLGQLNDGEMSPELSTEFGSSRWFERGWTLQELIAPREVWFFNQAWLLLGVRSELTGPITFRTRIPGSVLSEGGLERLPAFSVATKLSWAAGRRTTRQEDRAYSLLGLFGINMATLYGEGGDAAFFRLQSQIFHNSADHTLLAWQAFNASPRHETSELFAQSPDAFMSTRFLQPKSYNDLSLGHLAVLQRGRPGLEQILSPATEYSAFSHGMRIQLLMRYLHTDEEGRYIYVTCLACHQPKSDLFYGIRVAQIQPGQFKRISSALERLDMMREDSNSWFLGTAYVVGAQPTLVPISLGRVFVTPAVEIDLYSSVGNTEIGFRAWPRLGVKSQHHSKFRLRSGASRLARIAMATDPTFLRDEPTGLEDHAIAVLAVAKAQTVAVVLSLIAGRLKAAFLTELPDPLPRERPVENLRSCRWRDLSLSVLTQPLRSGRVLFVNSTAPNLENKEYEKECISVKVSIGTLE